MIKKVHRADILPLFLLVAAYALLSTGPAYATLSVEKESLQKGQNSQAAQEATYTRYTHQGNSCQDSPSRLGHFNAREYDCKTGHFASPDPISNPLKNPQDASLYSSSNNNPFKYQDPSGAEEKKSLGQLYSEGMEAALDPRMDPLEGVCKEPQTAGGECSVEQHEQNKAGFQALADLTSLGSVATYETPFVSAGLMALSLYFTKKADPGAPVQVAPPVAPVGMVKPGGNLIDLTKPFSQKALDSIHAEYVRLGRLRVPGTKLAVASIQESAIYDEAGLIGSAEQGAVLKILAPEGAPLSPTPSSATSIRLGEQGYSTGTTLFASYEGSNPFVMAIEDAKLSTSPVRIIITRLQDGLLSQVAYESSADIYIMYPVADLTYTGVRPLLSASIVNIGGLNWWPR